MKFSRSVTKLFNTPLAPPEDHAQIFGPDVPLEDLSASPTHSRRSVSSPSFSPRWS
jgi:hypothetical protein